MTDYLVPTLDADGKIPEKYIPPAGGNLPTGGTTGQILTKKSPADGDAGWQDPSGGGGSAAASTVVVIPAGSWSDPGDGTGVATVTVSGLTSATPFVQPVTRADAQVWAASKLWADGAAGGILTITATQAPQVDISVRVGWWTDGPNVKSITMNPGDWQGDGTLDVTVDGLGSHSCIVSPATRGDQAKAATSQLFVSQTELGVLHLEVANLPIDTLSLNIGIL